MTGNVTGGNLSTAGNLTGAYIIGNITGSITTSNVSLSGNITASNHISTGPGGFYANNGMYLNRNTISASYTLDTGYNGMAAGPITINNGVIFGIPDNQQFAVF